MLSKMTLFCLRKSLDSHHRRNDYWYHLMLNSSVQPSVPPTFLWFFELKNLHGPALPCSVLNVAILMVKLRNRE